MPPKRAKRPPQALATASQRRRGRVPPDGSRGGPGIPASGKTVMAEKNKNPSAKRAGTSTFSLERASSRLLAPGSANRLTTTSSSSSSFFAFRL
jgi:hypothetical protein